ncbi:sorbosone dehydrogenase [Bryobacterales bacterium F-183]|nr:sorbosone dehydrogenase [Bryobacterales bacterium F-183]
MSKRKALKNVRLSRVGPWLAPVLFVALLVAFSCTEAPQPAGERMAEPVAAHVPSLPDPNATPSVTRYPKLIKWQGDAKPEAPAGFEVSVYADNLDNPRNLHLLPNGDLLVAEANTEPKPDEDPAKADGKKAAGAVGKSANRVTLLRDANADGKPELRTVFAAGIKQPFGMALLGDRVYIAGTDTVWSYAYKAGATAVKAAGRQKIATLPAGGYNNHWTRNLIADRQQNKLYLSVGSASNVAEHGMEEERHRANILQMDPDGSNLRVYASGLRNPVGMDWNPATGKLWTVVNERDELGDELVPDYLTSVQENGFYGWPWFYIGNHRDPRLKGQRAELAKSVLVPDVLLGSHTATLGVAFSRGLPESAGKYRNGVFLAQHGSWNHSKFTGYRVAFIAFEDGKPASAAQDFLTGFLRSKESGEIYGRPTSIVTGLRGELFLADDAGGRIWRVVHKDGN